MAWEEGGETVRGAEPAAKWGRGAAPILSNTSIFEALAGLAPEPLRIDDHVIWVCVLQRASDSSIRKRALAPYVVSEHHSRF